MLCKFGLFPRMPEIVAGIFYYVEKTTNRGRWGGVIRDGQEINDRYKQF